MIVLYILLAILGFGFLIFIHELGHFLTARAFGVTVKEFSLGMGPAILSHTSKKTGIVYKLCALPIGGYVSMVGEEGDNDEEGSLGSKPAWQRLIVMASGGLVNILAGVLIIFILIASVSGTMGTTEVGRILTTEETKLPVSSADSGLREGDVILEIGGRRVHIAAEVDYEIMRRGVEAIPVKVLRAGEELTLTVTFPVGEESNQTLGRRDFYLMAAEENFGNVIKHSFYRSTMTVRMVWESLFDLIVGRYTADAVSGPVGVASAMTDAASSGAADFFYLLAVIALNLGVVNLFPLPALDGGRIFFLLIEIIIRRPVPEKVENAIHSAGFLLLLGLMLLVSCRDVINLFR